MRRALLLLAAACATTPAPPPTGDAPPAAAPSQTGEAKCPAALPQTSEAPKPVLGRTVVKVCLVGASEGACLRLHEVVAPREGTKLATPAVRADLEQLFAQGMVRDASAVAEPWGDGVVLSYFVTEYPFVKTVRFTGAAALALLESGDTITLGKAELEELAPSGSRASPAELQRLKNAVTARYQELGYSEAQLTAHGEEEVVLEVVEGPRTLVQALRFVGAKQVSEAELRKALKTTLGFPYRPDQVELDAATLSTLYFDRGMVAVSIRTATAPLEKSAGALELTFTIEEGPVYRLGRLSLTGHALQRQPELLKSFESKPKAVFSRAALKRDMERIRAWGEKQGVRLEVTPQTDLNQDKKIVDIAFLLEKSGDAPLPPF